MTDTNDTRYFLVEGGELLKRIEDFYALRNSQRLARVKLCEKYGTTQYYANSKKIFSFRFKDQDIPKDWVYCSKSGGWKPNSRTKAGKQEITSWKLPLADSNDLTYSIIRQENPFFFMDNYRHCRFMGVEKVDGKFILHVPRISKPKEDEAGWAGYNWSPPDDGAKELKTSEYWAMKEAVTV